MKEVGNQNFTCKFCNQGFASGRSLGGHMRWWHVNSIEFDEKRNITVKGFKVVERSGYGYGLREKPKKSSRVTTSISNKRGHSKMVQLNRLTAFVPKRKRSTRYPNPLCSNSDPSSSVAMYLLMLSGGEPSGYGMRENPKKSSGFMASNKRCYSEMVQSDRLTAFVPKRKRSRTTRSCSNSNASSSIDQELEDEVAMSLLMLSRGVSSWAVISSISDIDSITDYQVRNLGNQIENPNSSDCGNVEFGGDEQKRVGLEDSVDGFYGIDSSVTEMAELSKGLINGTGSETFEFNPRKKASLVDALDPELKVIPCVMIKVPKVFDDLLKEGKYKCRACGKIFYSQQALGGHRSCCHKTMQAKCKLGCTDNVSLSANLEVCGSRHQLKKSKVHQCPICFRVFASGQALGGHMGAHSVANNQVKVRQAIHPVIDPICNPNLAATLAEEEFNGHVGFNKCWMRSNHNYKPLLGLLSS